jgi:hypothetical protein
VRLSALSSAGAAPIAAEGVAGRDMSERVCGRQGCKTRLSHYNPGPNCWQHTGFERTAAKHRASSDAGSVGQLELHALSFDDLTAFWSGTWL